MKVAFFNTKSYDKQAFNKVNANYGHEIIYFDAHLNARTAELITDETAVCAFINDSLGADTVAVLAEKGVKLIALRSAGFNHVDLAAANDAGIAVVRVPAYSPYAVAEHAVALLQALNRRIHKAYNRVREGDFSINGLMGFDLHGKTVGVIGTGKIGESFCRIMKGFGCHVVAYDIAENEACKQIGVEYADLDTLFRQSDVISLHCPLIPATTHLIDTVALSKMKDGIVIINTSRGRLIDTAAIIAGLKTGKVGLLGLDVYEEEEELFFEDLSDTVIQDDVFSRLLTFPNVIVTSHQAFFTKEAVSHIAETTLENIDKFDKSGELPNAVSVSK